MIVYLTLTQKLASDRIGPLLPKFRASGMTSVNSNQDNSREEKDFGEFRRKVKAAEVLSAAMERLLLSVRFTGRVSVVVQNSRYVGPDSGNLISGRPCRL